MRRIFSTALALFATAILACAGDTPAGLMETPPGSGPQVVWDVDVRPIPEIPFPNDFALKLATDTSTGRRINISMQAATRIETEFRERAAELDGFGIFAPITVRFKAPLDLTDLVDRQTSNDEFGDDAVLLVDVTEGSPTWGEAVRLDFGSGWLPNTVMDPYFYGRQGFKDSDHPQLDMHDGASSLLFETNREDGVDRDGDGVEDVPNIHPADGNIWDDLITYYERETNTLLLRPTVPLRDGTRYAVVLTRHLKGEGGEAIRSPFPYVNLADQTDDLARLPEVLKQYGLGAEDVAFAWTFTTQSATGDLEAIRAGLYGHGAFGWLADKFQPDLKMDLLKDEGLDGSLYVLSAEEFLPLTDPLNAVFGLSAPVGGAIKDSYQYVGHVVSGRYTSPHFMADKDGIATEDNPANDDEAFAINAHTGEAVVAPYTVSFICVIPRADRGKQPFPVVLKTNGTSVPRLGLLAYAGFHARQGLATCSIDAFGHGFDIPPALHEVVDAIATTAQVSPLPAALRGTQIRDLDNDGIADSGGDFWSPDPFHSRDTIRQTVVDWMQFVRLLRSFGKSDGADDLFADGTPDLLGDWDGDGVPDIGTDDGKYSAWGISLGGIVTAVLAGIEPMLSAAVPQSGGGGLTDIAMRSLQPGVPQMVLYGNWGPMALGRPAEEGGTALEFMVPHFNNVDFKRFALVDYIDPGDTIELTNLKTGVTARALVNDDGAFRLGVQADALLPSELRVLADIRPDPAGFDPVPLADTREAGDPLKLCVFEPDGATRGCVDRFQMDAEWVGAIYPKDQPLVAMTRGMGRDRQTPDFRRLLGIAQAVLDAADPATYARHYFKEPLSFPYDTTATPGCNVLDVLTVGDANVPVSTGITLARSAGIVDADQMNLMVEHGVVEGNARLARYRTTGEGPGAYDPDFDWGADKDTAILFDIDDLDGDTDGLNAPAPAVPLRATVDSNDGGKSGLRVLYIRAHGSHGVMPPDPSKEFPVEVYGVNMITRYLVTGGTEIVDDKCLADYSCDFFKE